MPQDQGDRSEPKQMTGAHIVDIKNDEFTGQGEKRDEHPLCLNNALFSRHNILKGMVELHSNKELLNLTK
jgi:hypothetical protein